MTTRICHKCGKNYDNIVEFCPYCHAVNRNYHIPSETGAQKINASRVIKLASRVIKLICVGGIGLFLLAMLCGAISLFFYDPSSLSSSSSVTYPPITVDTQQKTSSSSSSAASAQVVKTTAIPQTTKKENLELINSHVESDSVYYFIVGTVKNNTNNLYSSVRIKFNIYDAKGDLIDNANDYASNLEPQGQWKFKVMITGDNPATYKLTELSGY